MTSPKNNTSSDALIDTLLRKASLQARESFCEDTIAKIRLAQAEEEKLDTIADTLLQKRIDTPAPNMADAVISNIREKKVWTFEKVIAYASAISIAAALTLMTTIYPSSNKISSIEDGYMYYAEISDITREIDNIETLIAQEEMREIIAMSY